MGSILVGIELVGTGHGYAKGRQRVQDADGVAVGCEHLGQALVAVGGFVEADPAQDYVSARSSTI